MAFTERSRAAREAVLAAARQCFATDGYERTTVRAVASRAEVDPSMVIRYFGSKEGLFGAAVDVDLRLPDLSAVGEAGRGEALARRFVALWDDGATGETLTVLLRSAATNQTAAARIRQVFADQIVTMVEQMDAGSGDPGRTRRRAGQLSAHILGTALTRYVLTLPPVAELGGEELVAAMAPILQAILRS